MSVEVIEPMPKEPTPELLRDAPDGQVRSIVFWPDERLDEVSKPVPADFSSKDLDQLVADMVYTMYLTGGMGLSAIQIGVPLRVFVCDIMANATPVQLREIGNQLLVAVNPVITVPDAEETDSRLEGCLSFPGVHESIERPKQVVLRAHSRKGEVYMLMASGMLGRVIQHEMDHLDGKTFLDRMRPIARNKAKKAVARFHEAVEEGTVRVGGRGPMTRKPRTAPRKGTRKRPKKRRRR
jgi:peptide deformylase